MPKISVGQKVEITYEVPGDPRWKAGEIGVVIENTYPEKYDVMVKLPDVKTEDGTMFKRELYFYENEVRVLN